MKPSAIPTRRLAALVAACLMPVAALAHDYTYLEGGYVDIDRRGTDDAGLFIGGSVDLLPPVALFAEYADTGPFEQLSAGALFHTRLNNTVDLVAGASLERAEIRAADDTGYGLRGGLRWWAVPGRFELSPELRYTDVLGNDATSLRATGLYRVTHELDVQALLQGGDDDRFALGVRYNFPGRR